MSRIKERIENFNRVYLIYNDAVVAFDKDKVLTHMALIHSFEICCELAWKVLKDYLFINGISAAFPKQVIKEAFNKELISDGQIWIDMIDARNTTSHEYNMDKVAEILIKMSNDYFTELKTFYNWINSQNL